MENERLGLKQIYLYENVFFTMSTKTFVIKNHSDTIRWFPRLLLQAVLAGETQMCVSLQPKEISFPIKILFH